MTEQINIKSTESAAENSVENELNFHSLFTAMTEGVAIHQMIYNDKGEAIDYIIREVNPSFEKNLGIPLDKAKGSLASELYGVTPPPYLDIYEHVIETGEPYYFTTYFKPLDRYFEISVFIPKDKWFATVFLDITGSRRAVEEIRSVGTKYRKLFESMMDGFTRTDMQGNIKEFNSSFQSMVGYREDELVRFNIKDITPEQWHEYEKRIVANQVIPYGYSNVYEKEYIRKDGTIFPVEVRISLIRDEKGKYEGMWAVVRDITDRKNAEEEIEHLLDRFNLATYSGGMGVWEWDIVNNNLLWDDKMFEIYGIEKEEFSNDLSSWEKHIYPDDITQNQKEIEQALRGDKEYDCEFRAVFKDGSIHYIKAYGQVVRNTAGKPLRLTGINFDITEQKKTQESLIISEMFNHGLVEAAPVGILFLDKSGQMTYENPAMKAMMGYPADAESPVTGKYFQELPQIKAVLSEFDINRILSAERINAMEIHYKSLTDKEVDLEIYTAPLLNMEGDIHGIILMSVDITKPVAARNELLESERKYRMLYESLRDGFVLMDMHKHIIETNSFFLMMTGYSQEEIANLESIRSIVPEKWYVKVDSIIDDRFFNQGYSDIFEIEYRRKDNSIFPVEVRLFLHKNKEGINDGMWGIVRDITERKKMENEVKEMNIILEGKVEQKTKELQERINELERFYKATIDRELRLKEMRTRIDELESMLDKINRGHTPQKSV
ncbi:MAG: PAS domain S-box protein [Bacteroidales bacterium]|jgi:PAS domain S-box-containing protein